MAKKKRKGKWIAKAIKHKGAFRKKAKAAGKSVATYAKSVLAKGSGASIQTKRQAVLAQTLGKLRRKKKG